MQALQPQDPDLTCPIDSKLLRNAVTTPCCHTAFCEECIKSYLSSNASLCPECESKVKNVSQLKPDEERRKRVTEYVDEMVRASKEQEATEADAEDKAESLKTNAEKEAEYVRVSFSQARPRD